MVNKTLKPLLRNVRWHHQTILSQFIQTCRDSYIAGIAMGLLLTKGRETGMLGGLAAGLDFLQTALGL
jgi:hypothetical protein